ncbi:uncharacterized protein STEHIDRAFT_128452 [Stereum hirsutum FP-91666 SS1]|uniref:uncharacterized protein n=1 Tax=Stereum hirsutum (strain FP-91666) TaxID=721885 RepID=UPI000440CDBB|nr:uncharacterized protein STEHIDRAFT_128452 [Stereum hirsutum FP-91666 SS1]EIM91636.1 hypothetical protein STEHIDRAFT_128452 [Stereum hirsutum FP-91666 SS1]
MYSLSTAHMSISLSQNLIGFFEQDAARGGITILNDQGSPLVYSQIAIEITNCLLGDSIVIWRAWVLWGRNWKIIYLPCTLILAGAGSGGVLVHAFSLSPSGQEVYSNLIIRWFAIFAGVTFTTNLYVVCAISYRIWIHRRQMAHLGDTVVISGGKYFSALFLLIESGAVYCVALPGRDDSSHISTRLRSSRLYSPTFVMSTPTHSLGASTRLAKPSEYPSAIRVLTRAFARDPCMNWFGGVVKMVPSCDSKDSHATKTMKALYSFQETLLLATVISGGHVVVAVVPNDTNDILRIDGGDGTIVGVTLWLKPGQTLDFGVWKIIRARAWKVLFGWGVGGLKRVLFDFSPAVEHSLNLAFGSRGLDRRDSWHLLEMVVDPPFEGKGISSLMMQDGFQRTSPKPIHLEATKARTRDIYQRFGFEVDNKHYFGVGSVDSNGLLVKGAAATGYPEWFMTKWKS